MSSSRPHRYGESRRVIGYIRSSTDEQSLGPVAQRHALEAWVRTRGYQLVAVHEDLGLSGGTELEKRPGLLAALDALGVHGAGVLLVAKRDRLARDVLIAAMVERLAARVGACVVSAAGEGEGNDPAAQLMRTICDAFAAYERALIRQRTRAALAVKRGRGERTGDIPYGYRLAPDGTHLEKQPEEQKAIAEVIRLGEQGLTLRATCDRLVSMGLSPRSGSWHPQKVARILRRNFPIPEDVRRAEDVNACGDAAPSQA